MIHFIILNLTALAFISGGMFLVWKLGVKLQKASVVDVFWSLMIAMAGLYFLMMTGGQGFRAFLMAFMLLAWALRLSIYILVRSQGMRIEDSRYRKLKEKWGHEAGRKMLKFYFQQGAGGLLFAWPAFFVGLNRQSGLGFFEITGFLIWLAAITGETMADWQLIEFKDNPENKGKVCRTGLWKYSRHPNYFFEWVIWIGVFIFTLGSPYGWISVICPLSMYHFLNNVTGVPFTEGESSKARGKEYEAYQKEVSAFFPWYPKKGRPSA